MPKEQRITVRLTEGDISGLKLIQKNAGFTETSPALKFCIHFTVTLLEMIPEALIQSFLEKEEPSEKKQLLR